MLWDQTWNSVAGVARLRVWLIWSGIGITIVGVVITMLSQLAAQRLETLKSIEAAGRYLSDADIASIRQAIWTSGKPVRLKIRYAAGGEVQRFARRIAEALDNTPAQYSAEIMVVIPADGVWLFLSKDDPTNARVVERALQAVGVNVQEFVNGGEAELIIGPKPT